MHPDLKWTVDMSNYRSPDEWVAKMWAEEYGVETTTFPAFYEVIKEAAQFGYRLCQEQHESAEDDF